jgi:hypothetical protein
MWPIARDENGSDMDRYHWYYICFYISVQIRIRIRIQIYQLCQIGYYWISTSQICDLSIQIRIRYRILNIRTWIRTDLNLSKWIRSRIQSKNICTAFIPTRSVSTNNILLFVVCETWLIILVMYDCFSEYYIHSHIDLRELNYGKNIVVWLF